MSQVSTNEDFPCGETIVMVRSMTDQEMNNEGWVRRHNYNVNPTCFVLSSGAVIYPSMDEEGNGPGEFFGVHEGVHIMLQINEKVS